MSTYWPLDPNGIGLTQPGLHALVIGVGDYPHLMGGAGHPAVANFGLRQLTTSTNTAIRIAEWLATKYRNPSSPLGSIELLLSPGKQVVRSDGSHIAIESPIMDNLRTAFNQWYRRCHAHAGNIAFFYFAGHGISTASQYLLPADFGDPNLPDLWANCVDFSGMRVGMRANAADTQLFFVDACRERPIDALIQNNPHGEHLCSSGLFDKVDASAAYFAAADGLQAYGPGNDITFFAMALLESLDGAGALNRRGKWVIDTFSLGNSLGQIMTNLAALHRQPLTCNPDPEGKVALIHCPSSAIVRISIGCRTDQANAEAEILLQRAAESLHSPIGAPRPWIGQVKPGDWKIELKFQSFPLVSRQETLVPPLFEMEEPV